MAGRKCLGIMVALALLVTAFGCAGAYGPQDQLQRRVDQFNDQVRWGRYFSAAEFIRDDARNEWLEERRGWGRDDLRIADWEIVDSTVDEDGETTIVRVVFSWYRLSQSEIQTTMLAQRWRRENRTWLMISEEYEEGAPL
jgi:Arc/MetJ-type ribon-helix-helix transcriptional regulator